MGFSKSAQYHVISHVFHLQGRIPTVEPLQNHRKISSKSGPWILRSVRIPLPTPGSSRASVVAHQWHTELHLWRLPLNHPMPCRNSVEDRQFLQFCCLKMVEVFAFASVVNVRVTQSRKLLVQQRPTDPTRSVLDTATRTLSVGCSIAVP